MTILNKSTMPELQITADETYDSPNMTATLKDTGLWMKHGSIQLDEGGISIPTGATVSGLVTPAALTSALSTKADTTALAGFVSSSALTTALAGKADASALTGKLDSSTAASTYATKTELTNAAKRIDTYLGTTDANGLFIVVYSTPFPAIPTVQPEPPVSANQTWVKVTSTVNGFSFRLVQRNSVNLLSTDLLLATTVNATGIAVRANVIAA